MRLALDKILQLYKTSPVFQDLIETGIGTAAVTGAQAAMTDMTPEELALASAATFGAGMIGRPIMGRAGQAVGGVIDRRYPQFGQEMIDGLHWGVNKMPRPIKEAYEAKMAPYKHLGGGAQYLNVLGRQWGDNAAQGVIGLASPVIFGGPADESQPGELPM